MRLVRAHVRDYRSVNDSGDIEVETLKTILVGVNEAGKTALLRTLQTVNPPEGTDKLEALRDYPRARYDDLQTGRVDEADVAVAVARYELGDQDRALLRSATPAVAAATHLELTRYMDNQLKFALHGVAYSVRLSEMRKDLARLRAHLAQQDAPDEIVTGLDELLKPLLDNTIVKGKVATALAAWLETAYPHVDEDAEKEEARFDRLRAQTRHEADYLGAFQLLKPRVPLFVYYSTYFTVRPRIHLASFAARQASGELDTEYDFGNQCLLKLLGFTAKELSELAAGAPPDERQYNQTEDDYQTSLRDYEKRLDQRQYRLNAASVSLTKSIRQAWGDEQVTLRLVPDGQFLKVVVVDDLGVEVELDQRSEGFRWLVSFFVVFRAQAGGDLKNAILLLDEPGVSLHALKQREFRKTLTLLGKDNQIIYTTHSPFMVGTDELDLVRIVEMKDRGDGTRVHDRLAVEDPRSIFPLQAALGYELAQTLFAQPRNLVCEGATEMFYVEGLSLLEKDAGRPGLRDNVALVPAHSASKVLYYSTVLTSQGLKVAALLDSDTAGERAAAQEELVRLLKPKEILRTKDHYKGSVPGPEIEDLLRDTLVRIARDELGWDVTATATAQPARSVVDIFAKEIKSFSKYRLARAFLKWVSTHAADDLTQAERDGVKSLFVAVNKALA